MYFWSKPLVMPENYWVTIPVYFRNIGFNLGNSSRRTKSISLWLIFKNEYLDGVDHIYNVGSSKV